MWDILDITSSDHLKSTRALEKSSSRSHGQKRSSATFNDTTVGGANAQDTIFMEDEPSQLADEPSEWSFEPQADDNTFVPGVPDIPDWMIFGDFMTQHL